MLALENNKRHVKLWNIYVINKVVMYCEYTMNAYSIHCL